MAELRLGGKRTEPKPDRRLGIKLVEPTPGRRLGGKLNAYVPPGAQYDYKPASVFARYKVLTAVFVLLALCLLSYWAWVSRHTPPAPSAAASAPSDGPAHASGPQPPQNQPVYIEPLPAK